MTADEINIDQETTDAIRALIHRIKTMGDTDPEFVAREFVMAMRGHGWRPTHARPAAPWQVAVSGEGAPPNDVWKAARAALDGSAGADVAEYTGERFGLGHQDGQG